MSCLVPYYNPLPPAAWSRVQGPCTFTNPTNEKIGSPSLFVSFNNKKSVLTDVRATILQYNKGNVLQYKTNNSNMSKQQQYAQVAKGVWKPRNVTWATQKVNAGPLKTYPNTCSLKRVNYKKIYLATGLPAPIDAEVTCPADYENVPYDSIVIADGGNLVCGTVENVCTGEVTDKESSKICNPSSNSDVPGPVVPLCWNDGLATWYPKPRYTMGTSGNKFPQGYKGFVSALSRTPKVKK